jgi:hypothetical protein
MMRGIRYVIVKFDPYSKPAVATKSDQRLPILPARLLRAQAEAVGESAREKNEETPATDSRTCVWHPAKLLWYETGTGQR